MGGLNGRKIRFNLNASPPRGGSKFFTVYQWMEAALQCKEPLLQLSFRLP